MIRRRRESSPQLDFFADAPVPAAPTPPAPPRPMLWPTADTPPAWRDLVTAAALGEPVMLVSEHYTGEVLETLNNGARAHFLHRDHRIHAHAPSCERGHLLLRSPDQARALHHQVPLVLTAWLSMERAVYRAARSGEAGDRDLVVPPFRQH